MTDHPQVPLPFTSPSDAPPVCEHQFLRRGVGSSFSEAMRNLGQARSCIFCGIDEPPPPGPAPIDFAAQAKEVGAKLDDGKPRWDLIPFKALESIVLVLTFGANKYTPDGWRHVRGWRWRYFRAAVGHVTSWWRGKKNDDESGLPHLAHAACCLMFLLELDE